MLLRTCSTFTKRTGTSCIATRSPIQLHPTLFQQHAASRTIMPCRRQTSSSVSSNPFAPLDTFVRRHIGPREHQIKEMLKVVGYDSLDALAKDNVPRSIQNFNFLQIGPPRGEKEMLDELREMAKKNKVMRSFIGMGYYGTIVPPVIQRNLLENPGWYTPYTPYQAEISQGRLESLLNYQTMVTDLTKMDISNASLLDEATAGAEAMYLCYNAKKRKKTTFLMSKDIHPQTIDVVKTRADILGVKVTVADANSFDLSKGDVCGVMIQYPATDGAVVDYSELVDKVHKAEALVVCATDLLSLTLLKPPGEWGADVALGSAQRFGVPMGFGGPHAAFFAVRDEFKRVMPGRLIGVSKDKNGDQALRMSLQTREQHIRRETATSNICTAQALLANMAAMYAVYHGPEGIKNIAEKVNRDARILAAGLGKLGYKISHQIFFDTVRVDLGNKKASDVVAACQKRGINVRTLNDNTVTVSMDETVTERDLKLLFEAFAESTSAKINFTPADLAKQLQPNITGKLIRSSPFLTHPHFNTHHSETHMMRYLKRLENRDISLTNTMIPLGSCTMKLNAVSEMYPVTWSEFGNIHPFVPLEQVLFSNKYHPLFLLTAVKAQGYTEMLTNLTKDLCNITGFDAVSLQPNAGSQGEYTGLRVILAYLASIGQGHRKVCLIPESAHGTNPASAAMCAMKIVVVKTDKNGNVDLQDLKDKCEQNKKDLACLMITYPSTYGVFEEGIKEICETVHKAGGQIYMDGANMNAQAGLCSPGAIGADVCHLNLHKTFCIPHGGGGPGMGPIGVAKHLAPFLPTHPVIDMGKFGGAKGKGFGAVSAAPFSSASILPISYVYIRLMGSEGIKKATQMAILNANYMANRLSKHYNIVYAKPNGLVAHEFILDARPFKKSGIEVEDIAKRLMDYGFHAPTMAFPIHDTLMIEPTESEPKEYLDRLCDALIGIREEIREVEEGKAPKDNNVLKNSPHTLKMVLSDKWDKPYSREKAAFPASWLRDTKYFPTVARIDGVYGDRNLICSCPPIENYQ